MKTDITNLFKKVFIFAVIFSIIGALMKIEHFENAYLFLIIGIGLSLLYMIIGIREVSDSAKISSNGKTFWTIGFLFFSFFTGIFYLIKRKEIV